MINLYCLYFRFIQIGGKCIETWTLLKPCARSMTLCQHYTLWEITVWQNVKRRQGLAGFVEVRVPLSSQTQL